MRTLVVTPSRPLDTADRVAGVLRGRRGFAAPEFALLDEAETEARRLAIDLILVHLIREHAASTLDTLRQLRDSLPAKLLVVGRADDAKLILRAVQAGASLFVDEDELDAELAAALDRFQPADDRVGDQVLAVLSASGGCGASTVAVNLAVTLAKARGGAT